MLCKQCNALIDDYAPKGLCLECYVGNYPVMTKHCRCCGDAMELVDSDPELGKMFYCEPCDQTYIHKGPGNAFDSHGWQ